MTKTRAKETVLQSTMSTLFGLLVSVLLGAAAQANPDTVHTWTSSDGKYSVEASLIGTEYDRTRKTTLFILRRVDDSTVKVPVGRLSKDSRRLATELLRERRAAVKQAERRQRYEAAQNRKTEEADRVARRQEFSREANLILPKQMPHGGYLQYIPSRQPIEILVVVHGMPDRDEDVSALARKFIKRWVDLAEKQRVVIVAPVFDQENFGSHEGPGGGYRGLFGREIGADEFVNEIVDQYQALLPPSDGKFMLYGHSAGGQFVCRYIVTHPERIRLAVISAAGKYAFPDKTVPWPYGLGMLRRTVKWPGESAAKQIQVEPDSGGWLAAAELPITVVVGTDDNRPEAPRPGHPSNNRHDRGRDWANTMNEYARANGREGNVRFVSVPGVGHSSSRLTPACQKALWR